jgi:hypothetical protein
MSAMVTVAPAQVLSHLTHIPADSDVSSIRFEGIKKVKVAARTAAQSNQHYCEEAAGREPGGSMFCPAEKSEAAVELYQVTYSYNGQPLPADESSARRFTFSVYFRPDELTAAERDLFSHPTRMSDVAGSFVVKTARGVDQRVVLDEANSTFCDAVYVDGDRVQTDRSCESRLRYKTVKGSSDYIAVLVAPAPSRPVTTAGVR